MLEPKMQVKLNLMSEFGHEKDVVGLSIGQG